MSGLSHNLHEIISKGVSLHTGGYEKISSDALALGGIQTNLTGETFTLWVDYEKGDEDGVDIWVEFYQDRDGTIGGRETSWTAIGGGVLTRDNRVYRLTASSSWFPIVIDTESTYKYFRVFQQVNGQTAPTGKIKCVAEIHKIAR